MSAAQPTGETLVAAVRTVLLLSEWTWQDGPPSPGLAEGLARRPRDTVGGCAGSRATATRYLSVGVDDQRINDLWFFTRELVQRVEISPLLPPSAGGGCSGQEAWRGHRLSRCPCSLRPNPEPWGPQTCHP